MAAPPNDVPNDDPQGSRGYLDLVEMGGDDEDEPPPRPPQPRWRPPEWLKAFAERVAIPVLTVLAVNHVLKDWVVWLKTYWPDDYAEIGGHLPAELFAQLFFSFLFALIAALGPGTFIRLTTLTTLTTLYVRVFEPHIFAAANPWHGAVMFGVSMGLSCSSMLELSSRFFRISRQIEEPDEDAYESRPLYSNPFALHIRFDWTPLENMVTILLALVPTTLIAAGACGAFAYSSGLGPIVSFGIIGPAVAATLIAFGYVWSKAEPVVAAALAADTSGVTVVTLPARPEAAPAPINWDAFLAERQSTWRAFRTAFIAAAAIVAITLLLLDFFLVHRAGH